MNYRIKRCHTRSWYIYRKTQHDIDYKHLLESYTHLLNYA